MFEGPSESLAKVAAQFAYAGVVSRQYTGVGGYTYFAVPFSAPFHGALPDGYVGGTHAIHQPSGAQGDFVLLVSGGCVHHLEFVTPDLEWPADEAGFVVHHHPPVT